MTIRPGREELPLSKHNVMQLLNLKTIIDNNIFLDDVDHLDPNLYTQDAYAAFSIQRKATLKLHLDASPIASSSFISRRDAVNAAVKTEAEKDYDRWHRGGLFQSQVSQKWSLRDKNLFEISPLNTGYRAGPTVGCLSLQ